MQIWCCQPVPNPSWTADHCTLSSATWHTALAWSSHQRIYTGDLSSVCRSTAPPRLPLVARNLPHGLPFEVKILVISCDTAISEEYGNLAGGEAWRQITRLLYFGVFGMGLSGPPCETYSAARHIEPPKEAKGRWPRPLRSPALLWGLPALRCREIKQVAMGSKLLLHSTYMELMVGLHGGATLMEHPLDRSDQGIPASWQAPVMTGLLKALPDYKHNVIEQWRFGSVGIKPTDIRTIGMVRPHKVLKEHEIDGLPRPKVLLAGLDSEGEWRTAAAKEYPPQLSRALAMIILETLRHRLPRKRYRVRQWDELPEDLLSWMRDAHRVSQTISEDAQMRPDYQGRSWGLEFSSMEARDPLRSPEMEKKWLSGNSISFF